MGMGFGSNYADVIEAEKVKELLPLEFAALESVLDAKDISFDDFCQRISNGDDQIPDDIYNGDDGIPESAFAAYDALGKAFEAKFPGLELHFGYHDQDDGGDRYDEVTGGFIHIGGLYQLTTAARALGVDNFDRKFFVTFG